MKTTTKKKPARFKVEVVHGESLTIFHVVDTRALTGEQPCVIRSIRNDRAAAEKCARYHNSIK